MKTRTNRIAHTLRLSALASTLAFSSLANAAFLTIDDSDPSTITITAGDFEGGLTVDGNLLTSGLGNSASVTLPDSGYSISGSWIDLGDTGDGDIVHLYFALGGDPTSVTSGLELTGSSDGSLGSISGSFGGFTGSPYFFGSPTSLQDGHTESGSFPFLSISFKSEAVPEPGSLALLGLGMAGLAAMRRRRYAYA